MNLISIIVPVYKVEMYLCKCIHSILNQTYENFELILIDDGSPDSCPEICDEYAKKDQRILVIHQENSGLSVARNMGLKRAKGEYILFVDSDDYIELDACENLIDLAEKYNVDIVTGRAQRIEKNNITVMKNYNTNNRIFSGSDYLKKQFQSKLYHVAACFNLYNRKFLIQNDLYFIAGIYHEDDEWTPRVFLKATRVISSECYFYNYFIRNGSITQMKHNEKRAKDLMKISKWYITYFRNIDDKELKGFLYDRAIILYFSAFEYNHEYYIQTGISDKFPCEYAQGKKIKFWAKLFSINLRLFYLVWTFRHWMKKCSFL